MIGLIFAWIIGIILFFSLLAVMLYLGRKISERHESKKQDDNIDKEETLTTRD